MISLVKQSHFSTLNRNIEVTCVVEILHERRWIRFTKFRIYIQYLAENSAVFALFMKQDLS